MHFDKHRIFLFAAGLFVALDFACTNALGKLQGDQPVAPYLGVRTEPAAASQVANFTSIRLRFDEPVFGAARVANYALEGNLGTLQISGVSEEADGSYLVSLNGIAARGTVRLLVSDVRDRLDRPVDPAGVFWYSEPSGPLVASSTPADKAVLSVLDHADICWDRATNGSLSSGAYQLVAPSGTSLVINSVSAIATNCYRLMIPGATAAGTYTLSWSGITDLVGNPSMAKPVTWTLDSTAPQILSTSPAQGSDLSGVSYIEVYFSETVNGASNKNNYALTGAGSGSLFVQAVNPLPDRYRLHLQGTPGSGSVQLVISNVTDLAGLALSPSSVAFFFP